MKEEHKVGSLLIVTLFSQMFLFSVAYTNATWDGAQNQPPDIFMPSQISQTFDKDLSIIADNLKWSLATSYESAKQPVLAFVGLDGYQYGAARSTVIMPATELTDFSNMNTPQVLGAYTESQ